jgi:hypothetical protein
MNYFSEFSDEANNVKNSTVLPTVICSLAEEGRLCIKADEGYFEQLL